MLRSLAIALAIAALFALAGLAGLSTRVEGRIYDGLLRMRRPAAAAREILLVDVDSPAVSIAGPWPWTRDIIADGLVLLKEMDARSALVDLPLAGRSPPSLDASALRQALPDALNREFSQMEENIQSLFDAIRRGSVKPRDSARYVSDLVGLVAMSRVRLFNAVMGIERDDDALLGQAAAFFGRSFVPIDLLAAPDPAVARDLVDQALERHALPVIVPGPDPSAPARDIRPPVLPLLRGAYGAGFGEVPIDRDGVRRRAFLTAALRGKHLGQAGFVALLDLLGSPAVELGGNRVLLRGAALPGKKPGDLSIPLTETGEFLIAWPRAGSGDGFRHLSWAQLLRHKRLEDSLVAGLREMDNGGYLSYLRGDSSLLDLYEHASRLGRDMLGRGNAYDAAAWRESRVRFFQLCDQFLNGDAETRILANAGRMLQAGLLSEEEKRGIEVEREAVAGLFKSARGSFAELQEMRAALASSVQGSLAILALDPALAPIGVSRTPFGAAATDASASAALASTILSGLFLREVPRRWSYLLAAALSLLLAVAVHRLRPLAVLGAGLGAACACAAVLGAVFVQSGAFMDPVAPGGSAAATAAALAILALSRTRRDTRALRAEFAGRLSPEGLRRVIGSRKGPVVGGSKRNVTALFASVKGMSLAAASMDPGGLLELTGAYHAAVREVILGLDGMLVGETADSITASFGAPLALVDHALRACRAALRMKAVEKELGIQATAPFAARIGIDTGECVVGGVGPRGRPRYSVLGAPTDLAMRLESLNARFGTSLLVTEPVRDAAAGVFLLRPLGRVPVAGQAPEVRVFELIAEGNSAEGPVAEAIGLFQTGLECLERGEAREAQARFSRVLALLPGDGPAAFFLERCRERGANPGRPIASFPC